MRAKHSHTSSLTSSLSQVEVQVCARIPRDGPYPDLQALALVRGRQYFWNGGSEEQREHVLCRRLPCAVPAVGRMSLRVPGMCMQAAYVLMGS